MKKNHAKERTNLPLADRTVSMSNALIRSAHGLKLHEKRVISIALAKTDSMPTKDLIVASRNGWTVRISAIEYAKEWGVSSDTGYEQLKDAADNLINRQVRTLADTPKGLKEIKTNWCGQCVYHHGEGWVEIAFTPQISPHLLGLREKFTSYKLKQASALRSIYSFRLFECLQSWKDTGVWYVDVPEFILAMDAPESCQNDFGNLRARVIEPAVKELRNKDNVDVTYELRRSGRKVTGLVFRFEQNRQKALDL